MRHAALTPIGEDVVAVADEDIGVVEILMVKGFGNAVAGLLLAHCPEIWCQFAQAQMLLSCEPIGTAEEQGVGVG